MPTFYDPVADADEASQALRGLAHASRAFEHPEDAYGVIGDLLSGVRSLQQSIRQLATRHTQHEGRAFNDADDQTAGIRDAHLTAQELTEAAAALDSVEERLNNASAVAGRIAWHPASPTAGTAPAAEPAVGESATAAGGAVAEPVERWVNVVFLQGDQADEVLWLIDRDGPEAAIDHLTGYDHGLETTDAAMENGYVYDTPPTSELDKQATTGEYALSYNPDMGHIGLYRRHQVHPADRLDTPVDQTLATGVGGAAAGAAAAGAGAAAGAAMAGKAFGQRATNSVAKGPGAARSQSSSWFARPGVEAVKRDHGISR